MQIKIVDTDILTDLDSQASNYWPCCKMKFESKGLFEPLFAINKKEIFTFLFCVKQTGSSSGWSGRTVPLRLKMNNTLTLKLRIVSLPSDHFAIK